MSKYEVVIGIETHVQLATKSKLFCGCNNDSREAKPNTHVCPVCLGFPGALPVLNGEAVGLAIRAGLALNGKIPEHTKFDRKNYFYPDSPMNYQITQFDKPIVGEGFVEFPVDGEAKRVGITRAHLEADAGKLVHPAGKDYSLVDLNRAGTPLLEIVSEPDMRSAAEAKAYAQELYNLMRYAEVSDCNLYYGNMRFDVNVSLRPAGAKEFGTRTESKNLNSFRAVAGVVEYEMKRQAELLDKGERVVQETRGWDENKNMTFSQRSKEEAHDYRYFPEPDLPPLVITESIMDKAKGMMPAMMPNDVRQKLDGLHLNPNMIEAVVGEPEVARMIVAVSKSEKDPEVSKVVANFLIGTLNTVSEVVDVAPINEDTKLDFWTFNLMKLGQMTIDGDLSKTAAKELLNNFMVQWKASPSIHNESVEKLSIRLNLKQVSDIGELEKIVDQVIAENPVPVEQYKAGEQKVIGFLVGQVMKLSKGQANPPMVNDILRDKLK